MPHRTLARCHHQVAVSPRPSPFLFSSCFGRALTLSPSPLSLPPFRTDAGGESQASVQARVQRHSFGQDHADRRPQRFVRLFEGARFEQAPSSDTFTSPPLSSTSVARIDVGRIRFICWDLGGQRDLHTLWDKVGWVQDKISQALHPALTTPPPLPLLPGAVLCRGPRCHLRD